MTGDATAKPAATPIYPRELVDARLRLSANHFGNHLRDARALHAPSR